MNIAASDLVGESWQSTIIQIFALACGAWASWLAYRSRRVQVNVRRLKSLTTENDELREDLVAMAAWAYEVRADLAQRGITIHPPPRLVSPSAAQSLALDDAAAP